MTVSLHVSLLVVLGLPKILPTVDQHTGDNFEVGVEVGHANYTVPHGNFSKWDILDTPMWLDFADPTIDHIGDYSWGTNETAMITENFAKDEWVYLIIAGQGTQKQIEKGKRVFVPVAHPMHLHGHDFVLLSQQTRPFHPDDVWNGTFKYDNPPRRDVALMPRTGYMAMGFKTDNPGLWIMHCHIAWHASSGLALQIRENESQIKMSRAAVREKDRVCKNWRKWYGNKNNWWNPHEFQEDSGI
jgi:FtsP/CotA-like multicopper oxidase with cupredoxin domain